MKTERSYHVSGTCDLLEGYRLAYVTPNAQVEHVMPETALCRILQPSYSLASGVISIVQIFSTHSALCQLKSYQIDAYGYAAFGFTVTPYLVMSFLNLLANCFTPTFPNLYLVHTEMMDEAISRAGQFTDIVGKIESEPLLVEDLTLFSASIEPVKLSENHGELKCRIATEMFEHGSTEPIPDGITTNPERLDGKSTVSDIAVTLISPLEPSVSSIDEETAQKQASMTAGPMETQAKSRTGVSEE